MLYLVYAPIPRMQLDLADLDEAKKACKIIDPEPRAFAGLRALRS